MLSEPTICGVCEASLSAQLTRCTNCQSDPRLKGKYRLLSRIGQGASGITWRAYQEDAQRFVCLKELRWANLSNLDEERRFAREGAVLTALNHPSIPRFFEFFSAGQGRNYAHYIALELIDGQNLDQERRHRGYTFDEILYSGISLAETLRYLHERHPSVVHRDIKPSNIMRRRDGSLVLLDFGAARLDTASHSQVSTSGTLGYMAPEQVRGESGPASDIYALGMTLATLLSGHSAEQLLSSHNTPDFTRIPQLAPGLRQLLELMCAKNPSHRPTAAKVLESLKALQRGELRLSPLPNSTAPIPSPRSSGRGKYLLMAFLGLGLAGVGAAAFFTASVQQSTLPSGSMPSIIQDDEAPTELIPSSSPKPAPPESPLFPDQIAERAMQGCRQGDKAECDTLERQRFIMDASGRHPLDWPAPLIEGCEKKVAQACASLGAVYYRGDKIVAKSMLQARTSYERACELGHQDSCKNYADMLAASEGGPEDNAKALEIFERICEETQDISACRRRAQHLRQTDPQRSLVLLTELCERKDDFACSSLNNTFTLKKGVPKDLKARRELLTRLCSLGACEACSMAHRMFSIGQGGPKDPKLAHTMAATACDKGCNQVCKILPK